VVWLPGLLGFLCDTWVVDDEIGDEFSKGERSTVETTEYFGSIRGPYAKYHDKHVS